MSRALGVCYYPEHWPEEDWEGDARRMVETGLRWVRIGEFAWSKIEPNPDSFAWDWLDRAIDVLGTAGLDVILGTPTATPPRWMLDRHPDMLAHDANGRPRRFGSRRHYCFSHVGYRGECQRIARLLGKRYGQNPFVKAWQIDNEYGCHDTTISYSPAARDAFRAWCRDRYGSVDALNKAWGNVFWSMDYRDFDDIDLPNLTVTEPNPAHAMAFRRFTSDQVIAFNQVQVRELRAQTDRPLLHNYMGRVTDFDHYDVGTDLDIATWDSYPIGFLMDRLGASPDHRKTFMRQGDPDFQAFHHDLYRSVGRGRWWIIEQQPGPVNWAAWNPAPLAGMARLWAWEAFAHGAEAVCYFRWRQAPFGQEQHHSGLLRADGAPAPALGEAEQVAQEIAAASDAAAGPADVALVFDYPSQWAWETQPQGRDFDYFELIFSFYRGLRRLGLNVDIVSGDAPMSGRKLVIAPGMATMGQDFLGALGAFEGQALLGPRTNARTAEMSLPVPLPPNLPGLDARVARLESLPPFASEPVAAGGSIERWFETLEGTADVPFTTEAGQPVALRAGGVTYLAGWPDDTLLDRILQDACSLAGITPDPVPAPLRQRKSATHRYLFNYSAASVSWRGTKVPAAGVLREKL
ncbi:MAG: beta-galactosidase [Pseudomonadota bacterium]